MLIQYIFQNVSLQIVPCVLVSLLNYDKRSSYIMTKTKKFQGQLHPGDYTHACESMKGLIMHLKQSSKHETWPEFTPEE